MAFLLAFSLIVTLVFFVSRFMRKNSSIAHIPGPRSPSWILGHELVLSRQGQVGDNEFKWFRQYGPVVRTRGVLGDDVLMVADAKALQHILHTSGYRYPKAPLVDRATKGLLGNGLVTVGGMVHQRQRKVLLPGFSLTQLRTFSSLFQQRAKQGAMHLKDQFLRKDQKVMDVYAFLGRITLDVIGKSAFRYEFNALEDGNDDLFDLLKHLFDDISGETTYTHISNWIWTRLPSIFYSFPAIGKSKQLRRFSHFQHVTKAKAREILSEKDEHDSDFMAGKDILSILVRANESEDEKKRLDEDEVLAQASTMLLAGYETSASTMTWALYELSKRPDQQAKIRREIAEARSSETLSPQDYDGMQFMNAVIKETLRLHPIVPTLQRVSAFDDVLPLSQPVVTTTGDLISEIPVRKGQAITVAIHYYNRNPFVWGSDANEWNPERFLTTMTTKEKDVNIGVFANLLTFSAGIRGCIGWRFAVMEMQTILVELMDNFEFSLPDEEMQIHRQSGGVMLPFVKGKMSDGPQMPLCVAPL